MIAPKKCPNCRATNPAYKSACYRCNAALTSDERTRRLRRSMLNEQREANGKEPLPVERVDESVEPVERSVDLDLLFLVLILLVCIALAVHYGGLGGLAL